MSRELVLNTQPSRPNQLMSFAIHKRKIDIFKLSVTVKILEDFHFLLVFYIKYATYLASYMIKTDTGKNYKRFLSTSI